jgi:7-cyano-7-deazaguanine synthase in queuosine biosynthesis
VKKGNDWFVWCGPEKLVKKEVAEGERTLTLNTLGSDPNVHLILNNISRKLAHEIPSLLLDCLELASYVYAADQSVSRGGATLPGDGESWRRKFRFNIPVRELEVWQSTAVGETLVDTLSFLTDDYYEFSFRKSTREFPTESYFEFDEGEPWFKADEVMLFSGGLDSLAGLIQSTEGDGRKVALVSHRAAPQVSARQKDLLEEFDKATNGRHDVLHIPVWVNKLQELTKDANQRSRSFLFTMLGVVVADMHKLDSISFYENGVTSCNLPISEQLVGSRASRTTHPLALYLLSELVSLLLSKKFTVRNPLFWKTKTEAVKSIGDKGLGQLIRHSCSCSHVRTSERVRNHCGVCSQCIDRRFAMLASGMASDDPEDLYQVRFPLDPISGTESRTMAMSYLDTARDLDGISIDNFFIKYGEASRLVGHLDMRVGDAAPKLLELHKRHGSQVCSAMTKLVHEHADLISRKNVHPESLLAMIAGPATTAVKTSQRPAVSLPEGTKWEDITMEIIGLDAAKVYVGSETFAVTAKELGFLDKKRGRTNRLWDLLSDFAEAKGTLGFRTKERSREWNQKDIQRLRNALKAAFGLFGDPILPYDKKTGYSTRFKILYDRSAKT